MSQKKVSAFFWSSRSDEAQPLSTDARMPTGEVAINLHHWEADSQDITIANGVAALRVIIYSV